MILAGGLVCFSAIVFFLSCGYSGDTNACSFKLNESASLEQLKFQTQELLFSGERGGFSAYDVTNKKPIDFPKGITKKSGEKTLFTSLGSDEIKLHAEFITKDEYIIVNGFLENLKKDDRAVILDYSIGVTEDDACWSSSLNGSQDKQIADIKNELENNVFPISAIKTGDTGIAMAIPPYEPRIFGMVGSSKGFSVRFYLGISPLTAMFSNKASFSFIIYPIEGQWGFRSALEKYYSFYPERYEPKAKHGGVYMYMVKGIMPPNADQYAYNILETHHPKVQKDLDRDDEYNIASMAYTIVGQREIKFLDSLPQDYDEAMKVYENWTLQSYKEHPLTKENAVAYGDLYLKEEVKTSACKEVDGRNVILLRNTPWGKDSVSFKINPSPYIYKDKDVRTVGKDSIEQIDEWLTRYPQIDGVSVDSYGANWPAVLNYNREHFKYVRYPLTFDPEGNLAIHNQISHYEYTQYLNDKLTALDKLIFANGIYTYKTRYREHYRATDIRNRIKLGRFFCSALLDGSSSERGIRVDVETCQDVRIFMGRKYHALFNYHWQDPEKVEEFYNRSLCYAIFASNTKDYFSGGEYIEHVHEGVDYVNNPEGYYRDKKLIDWFVPKARMLYQAGWQPVSYAHLTGENVYLERYGNGKTIYFTVFNDSDSNVEAVIKFDLNNLGFKEQPEYKEISYNAEPKVLGNNTIKLSMEPYKTYIISITKP
jgi:hypothetical protein